MDFCRFNDILCISSHFILVTLNQHKNKKRQKKISPFLSLARGIWYDCVVFVENMVIVRSPLNRNDFLCFYSQTVCFFCWFCVFVAEIKPKIIQNQSERSIKAKINRWWTKIKHQTKQIFYVKTEENVNHWFVMANKLNVFFFSLRLFVFRWLTFFSRWVAEAVCVDWIYVRLICVVHKYTNCDLLPRRVYVYMNSKMNWLFWKHEMSFSIYLNCHFKFSPFFFLLPLNLLDVDVYLFLRWSWRKR